MTIAPDDEVTFEYTGRLEDGTVFDTSKESVAADAGLVEEQPERDYEPLTVEIGEERIIEGLEEALLGLDEGDAETVSVPPEKGYGEWSEEQVHEYDLEEFTEMVGGERPEEGAYIEVQQGGIAQIVHVDDEVVRVDFNHSLAGETLEFDVEVLSVN